VTGNSVAPTTTESNIIFNSIYENSGALDWSYNPLNGSFTPANPGLYQISYNGNVGYLTISGAMYRIRWANATVTQVFDAVNCAGGISPGGLLISDQHAIGRTFFMRVNNTHIGVLFALKQTITIGSIITPGGASGANAFDTPAGSAWSLSIMRVGN